MAPFGLQNDILTAKSGRALGATDGGDGLDSHTEVDVCP